jgi:NAD(P)-dependent dehydrogenase (short-subunit alcohol dehydrogenase family)
MHRFSGRAAIVTGGAQGIGRSVVTKLAAEGASVLIADIDGALAESTAHEFDPTARRILAAAVDVSKRDQVQAAIKVTLARFGRLDIMVSHAGIVDVEPFLEQDDESWTKMLTVNVLGAFICVQEAARAMKEAGTGTIVITTSTNAFWIESNASGYNASKGGTRTLMRSAALELAPLGIRVNSVAPGVIRTRLTRHRTDDPQFAGDALKDIPLGRFGEPEDVANAILFLASDDASWITGHDLVVDGGQTIGTPLPLPPRPHPGSSRADRMNAKAAAQ